MASFLLICPQKIRYLFQNKNVSLYQGNDGISFEGIYHRHAKWLFSFCKLQKNYLIPNLQFNATSIFKPCLLNISQL